MQNIVVNLDMIYFFSAKGDYMAAEFFCLSVKYLEKVKNNFYCLNLGDVADMIFQS